MNIADSKEQNEIIAKTCGCKNIRKVSYSFEACYNLYKKKSERLRNYGRDELDPITIEKEITELTDTGVVNLK
jgi:hypothetical protein